MASNVSRRDFLNGVGLSIAAGLAPIGMAKAASGQVPAAPYPPGLTGLRGSNDASFEVMHGIAREGRTYSIDALSPSESYDLVVIGTGLAGLTAAWAHAQRRPKATILLLDNHDDFGGHARRCELDIGGRALLGYGGSESLVAPRSKFKGGLRTVLRNLGIEPEIFYRESVFHRSLYPRLGLSRGVFFDKETFGEDRVVAGDPLLLGYDEFAPANPNARTPAAFLRECPLSEDARTGLMELFAGRRDYLEGLGKDAKLARLAAISYRAFLLDVCRLPGQAADFFQGRPHDNFALGIDALSAREAMTGGFPGARSLHLKKSLANEEEGSEPYIHHFPDGNATVARALVRALIPDVAPRGSIADLIGARLDYGKLDQPGRPVRLRLNATATLVRNEAGGVAVGYVRNGVLERVHGKHAVVATFASVVPHICPDIDRKAHEIWSANVRAPLLYTKVVVRNWSSFIRLGVHKIAAPMAFSSTVKLDYPVSLGAYRFPRKANEPMGLQLVHVPLEQNKGHDARTLARLGRQWLLETPFDTIESRIRSDLQRMLGKGGFDQARDIAAITVNRWSHGYSYMPNTLFDDMTKVEGWKAAMRARNGNIVFANSDTAWDAYAHSAMGEALRAVEQLL